MDAQEVALELCVLSGPGAGSRMPLRQGENLVGRNSRLQVRLDSPAVSRRHLVIFLEGDDVVVRDLASRNGTRVNGARLSGTGSLALGDVLEVGDVTVRLEAADPVQGSPRAGAGRGLADDGVPEVETTLEVPVVVDDGPWLDGVPAAVGSGPGPTTLSLPLAGPAQVGGKGRGGLASLMAAVLGRRATREDRSAD
jgi:hypothetical protein